MDTLPVTTKYKNHRFPVEIIGHAVWLALSTSGEAYEAAF
jgi:hypothetical protein